MKRKLIALVTAFAAITSFVNCPAISDMTNFVSYGASVDNPGYGASGEITSSSSSTEAPVEDPISSSSSSSVTQAPVDTTISSSSNNTTKPADTTANDTTANDTTKPAETTATIGSSTEDSTTTTPSDGAEGPVGDSSETTTAAAPVAPSTSPIYGGGSPSAPVVTTTANTNTTTPPESDDSDKDSSVDGDVNENTDANETVDPTEAPAVQIEEEKYEVAETVTVDAADVEDEEKVLEVIAAAAEKATEDEKIAVVLDMTAVEEKVVTEAVLEAVKGKDIVLVLEVEEGFEWKINGKDITETSDIDLTISKEVKEMPSKMVKKFKKNAKHTVTLSIAHDGEFGFEAVLSVNVEKENEGAYANLYYYNPETDKAEFQGAGKIKKDGKVDFLFKHASEYIITVTDEPAEEEVVVKEEVYEEEEEAELEDEDTSKTEEDVKEDKDDEKVTTEADSNPATSVALGFSGVLFSAATVALLRKKKN